MASDFSSGPLNDAGLADESKPLLVVDHPTAGPLSLNAAQILQGYGNDKSMITASYTPQSGIAGPIEGAQYDIIIPKSTGNSGVNIVEQLFLQIDVNIKSSTVPTNVALKPLHQWFLRLDLTMDGSSVIQSIYFDKNFTEIVNNSDLSNIDDIKSQINLDPRNGLCWFDENADGGLITVNATGNVTAVSGKVGRSTYLSQPYFNSGGLFTGTVEAGPVPPANNGQAQSYKAFAKGGYLNNGTGSKNYRFYLPIHNTFLQSSKILMNKLNADVRFKFYMNNQVKLYDEGTGPSASTITINQATLWVVGKRLASESLALLDEQYLNPVVSNFNYYLEYTQDFQSPATGGTMNEAVLSPLVGNASQIVFWLEDTRPDIKYPGPNGGGDRYIQNNMMTLPVASYQFIKADGSPLGSGLYIPDDLIIMMNTFRKTPKSVAGDNRLYFRKYYSIDFTNDPITAESGAVYGGYYPLTGKERIRFYLPDAAQFPADVFPNVELNPYGNAVDAVPTTAPYSRLTLHVVAVIAAEAIEYQGQIKQRIPRING